MAETYFSGLGDQKILAEKAEKDINGNSLELTISDNKVTAIGGVSVSGSGSETNIIETVEVEGTPLTVTNKTVNITKTALSLNNVDNTSDSTKKTNFTGSIANSDTGFVTGGDVYTALSGKVDTASLSSSNYTIPYNKVSIGGRKYSIVQIGNQLWMAENLDYKWNGLTYGANGSSDTTPMANYYDKDETTYGVNGNKYGLLYNWPAAKYLDDNKGQLLPAGWHVPTKADCETLTTTLGGATGAALKLKSTTGWADNGNGDGSTSFAVYPTGRWSSGFESVTRRCDIWSKTLYSDSQAWYISFVYDRNNVDYSYNGIACMSSIRLVKNL